MLVIPWTFDSESSNLNFEVFRLNFANFTRLTAVNHKPYRNLQLGSGKENLIPHSHSFFTIEHTSSQTSVIGYPEYRFFSNSPRIHTQILSNSASRVAAKSLIPFPDSRTTGSIPFLFQMVAFPGNIPTEDYPLYFPCLKFVLNIQFSWIQITQRKRKRVARGMTM